MNPGTYNQLPFEQYLAIKCWSQSSVKQALVSPAHAKAAFDGEHDEPTDAMVLGSALHLAFLEPNQVRERMTIWEGKVRRGKEWDAFRAQHTDKIILTVNQAEKLWGMLVAMRAHPYIKAMLPTTNEATKIGDVCGLRMKGRADAIAGRVIYDIKKVADAEPRKLLYAIRDYGYDLQAAVYCELFDADNFIMIAVEDSPPYDVVPLHFTEAMLDQGRIKMQTAIGIILECERTGHWPGRAPSYLIAEPDEIFTPPSEPLPDFGEPS